VHLPSKPGCKCIRYYVVHGQHTQLSQLLLHADNSLRAIGYVFIVSTGKRKCVCIALRHLSICVALSCDESGTDRSSTAAEALTSPEEVRVLRIYRSSSGSARGRRKRRRRESGAPNSEQYCEMQHMRVCMMCGVNKIL
jgi:hypothetical protein